VWRGFAGTAAQARSSHPFQRPGRGHRISATTIAPTLRSGRLSRPSSRSRVTRDFRDRSTAAVIPAPRLRSTVRCDAEIVDHKRDVRDLRIGLFKARTTRRRRRAPSVSVRRDQRHREQGRAQAMRRGVFRSRADRASRRPRSAASATARCSITWWSTSSSRAPGSGVSNDHPRQRGLPSSGSSAGSSGPSREGGPERRAVLAWARRRRPADTGPDQTISAVRELRPAAVANLRIQLDVDRVHRGRVKPNSGPPRGLVEAGPHAAPSPRAKTRLCAAAVGPPAARALRRFGGRQVLHEEFDFMTTRRGD
jgi:hypothetical protein